MNTALKDFFTAPLPRAVYAGYRRIFSVHEIETSKTLQWLFGAMLLFFYATFYDWIGSSLLTKDTPAVCWPYFTNCNALHFLSYLPYGYSQTTFYMLLFGVMLLIVYSMYKKWWTLAHVLMVLLWLWKTYASFVLSWSISGVYDYYHIILTAGLLFIPHKEYFTKVGFVLLYFLSSTIKFYPSWVLGTYFTSLKLGLPLLPQSLTVFWTASVIFSQIIGCWFLLSGNRVLQRIAVVYYTIFHLYSGVLVRYPYPTITEPTLLILFGPLYRHQRPPLRKTAIAGWIFLALIFLFQTPVHFINGDEKLTMEGYRFGMWMFDANHQCISTFTQYYASGDGLATSTFALRPQDACVGQMCVTKRVTKDVSGQWMTVTRVESPRGEVRCAPYTVWQEHMDLCAQRGVTHVAFTFDHSVNGGPFYRVVDEQNMCNLTFNPFAHNDWIHEPPQAPIVGYPVEDTYY